MSEIFTKYIANEEHYSEVIERIAKVRDTLWIGTADIKDLYVKQNGEAIPLLGQIAGLLKRVWACGLFTPRNRARISARTSTGSRFSPRTWSECFAPAYTSRW